MRNSGGGQGTLMTSILRPFASGVLVRRSYASVERSYCARRRDMSQTKAPSYFPHHGIQTSLTWAWMPNRVLQALQTRNVCTANGKVSESEHTDSHNPRTKDPSSRHRHPNLSFPESCPSVWGACLGVVDVVAPGQRDHARADEAGQVIYVPVHHLRARPASPCVPYHMSARCTGTHGKQKYPHTALSVYALLEWMLVCTLSYK